ncbi:hypothetical protein RHMOL_Rhmol04G0254200 [Rhododendron molle]|uniref:Uncharacterized protein n=1 Tax=Rhododendron molle TaxID=49168 RepID=A0ACC0P491_RHOML|nr:hypothetical protein RHMOL_Rhmol04G0254200 [Rhododendron molle]
MIRSYFLFKLLDASWYMPDEQKNPLQEYKVLYPMILLIYFCSLSHEYQLDEYTGISELSFIFGWPHSGALFFDVDGISDQTTKPLVFRIKTAWLFMMESEFSAQLEFGGEFSWG